MNSGGCLLPAVSWEKRLLSATTYKKTLLIGLLAGPSITHRAEEEETVDSRTGWKLCCGKGASRGKGARTAGAEEHTDHKFRHFLKLQTIMYFLGVC